MSEQVKSELKELRYYYFRKESLESDFKITGAMGMRAIAKKYEAVINKAPIRLYDLFCALYVHNKTQDAIAMELCYTPDYIRKLQKELFAYLENEFKKGEQS